jgi:hypothetical protein
MTKAAWKGRAHFAEIAETLGVDTEMILLAQEQENGRWFVIYTPDYPEDPTLHSIWLGRGQDGVLIKTTTSISHPGMHEEIKRKLKEMLGE